MASGDGDAPHARRQADLHPRWRPPTRTAAAPSPAPVDQTSIGSRCGRRGGSDGACQPGGVGAGGAAGRIRHCRAGSGTEATALKRREGGEKAILIPPRPWHPRGVLDSPCSGSWVRPIPRPDQETPRWLVRFLARFLVLPPADRDEGWIAREDWECEWAGGGV